MSYVIIISVISILVFSVLLPENIQLLFFERSNANNPPTEN